MKPQFWQNILLSPAGDDRIWELFHENSKLDRYTCTPSTEEIRARMAEFHESLPFLGYPVVELPRIVKPPVSPLGEVIRTRVSTQRMNPCLLSLQDLASLLHYSYGVTRDNKATTFPRPFRAAPSGGALYPLEIFFHSAHIEGAAAGLYHYNPTENRLYRLHEGDESNRILKMIVNQADQSSMSLTVFITALFERSAFKYGARGYRFIFLEAGHVAQNMNLVATALGLGCLNIGGFFDREVDDYLGLDGLTHSTIYIIAIGGKK